MPTPSEPTPHVQAFIDRWHEYQNPNYQAEQDDLAIEAQTAQPQPPIRP